MGQLLALVTIGLDLAGPRRGDERAASGGRLGSASSVENYGEFRRERASCGLDSA